MKIYFTASGSQKDVLQETYSRIIKHLEKKGHEVLEKVMSEYLPEPESISSKKTKDWIKQWSNYIKQCDVAVVEGTYPSTINLGFETAMMLSRGKPVILLYKDGKNPFFINKLHSSRLVKSPYSEETVEETLDWCLEEVKELSSRRFTFYITPDIDEYLDEVSSKKDLSKSEFIRSLIEGKMKDDQ